MADAGNMHGANGRFTRSFTKIRGESLALQRGDNADDLSTLQGFMEEADTTRR